jgi:hypothetical protein
MKQIQSGYFTAFILVIFPALAPERKISVIKTFLMANYIENV